MGLGAKPGPGPYYRSEGRSSRGISSPGGGLTRIRCLRVVVSCCRCHPQKTHVKISGNQHPCLGADVHRSQTSKKSPSVKQVSKIIKSQNVQNDPNMTCSRIRTPSKIQKPKDLYVLPKNVKRNTVPKHVQNWSRSL